MDSKFLKLVARDPVKQVRPPGCRLKGVLVLWNWSSGVCKYRPMLCSLCLMVDSATAMGNSYSALPQCIHPCDALKRPRVPA